MQHIKRLLLCSLMIFVPKFLFAQIGLTIDNTNIGSEVSTSALTFSSPCLLSIVPTIKVRTDGNLIDAATGNAILLSKNKVQIASIGGLSVINITIAGSTFTEQPLGTSDAQLYTALLGLSVLSNSNVVVKYRITQSDMIASKWDAGVYTTGLIFTTPGSTLCLGSATFNASYTVTVSPFINVVAPANLILTVDDFKYFHNTTIITTHDFAVTTTVAHNIKVKASNGNFAYNPVTANTGASITTDVNKVTVQPTNALAGTGKIISLPTASTTLMATGIATIAGNQTTTTIQHSISPADMKLGFTYAGSYTIPLSYDVVDARTSPASPAATQTVTPTLTVNVSDMGNLTVNNTDVDLNFGTAANYLNGVSADITSHLTVSKTTPYDIYVKAGSANLTNGANTIPVGVLKIGPGSSETGVSQITLSTTSQRIINAASPVIDRNINIKYSILAADVSLLLAKPAGTYTASVIYSFTAL